MSKNARSRMWSRWLSRKPAAELPVRSLGVETLEDRLAPATFTWSGAGANAFWSTPANWEGGVAPTPATPNTTTTPTQGSASTNEIQTFLVPGAAGTFSLFNIQTGVSPVVIGSNLPTNAPLAAVQAAFDTAYGAGNTLVTVAPQGPDRLFTVTFQGGLQRTDVNQVTSSFFPAGAVNDLVFPDNRPRPANQNDLFTGTVINQITVQGQLSVPGSPPVPYSITEAPDATPNLIILGNGSPSSGNFTVQPGSGNVTFGLPTNLATNGDQSLSVGGAGSILSMTAPVIGSALNNLNKDGFGQLELRTASPNLIGGVKVNQGVLQIRNTLALGPAGGVETVVGTGAALYLNNVVTSPAQPTIGEQLRLNGGGIGNIGALYLEAGNAVWSGQVILETGITSPPQAGGPGTVIGAFGDTVTGALTSLNITGLVTDSGAGMGLVKEGAGEVKLGSTTGNTYRGQTNVNNGILTVTHPLSLGDSRQTNPGAFQNPTSGTVVNVSPGRSGQLRMEAPAGSPGFKVVGEYLVLNGAGPATASSNPVPNVPLGALHNARGDNTWAGSVILGSPAPDGASVSIGVEPATVAPAVPSSLTISGVVSSPFLGNAASLTKEIGGRLILTNSNTYTGQTIVNGGSLAIRDSQGLGPAGTSLGTTVNRGAAVELDVEAAYAQAVVPRFDDLGRDTWADSITNDAQRLTIREAITLNGRGLGATNLGTGTTALQSTGGTGAIRSWTGINTWVSTITLASGEASIGVELDGTRASISGTTSRAGHPLPDSSYFRDDYSLTIQDQTVAPQIGILGSRDTDFVKLGGGHLILPQANPYLGRTLIEQGWVTIQNNRSLGDSTPRTDLGKTAQQPTVVKAGAALHIAPTATGSSLTILEDNIVLEGLGLGSLPLQEQHPYSYINQKGALVNLRGENTVVGDVGVISTGFGTAAERGAGIGVERVAAADTPPGSLAFEQLKSKLTITGDVSDGITYQQSFNQNTGVTSRVYNVGATRGRISVPYNFGTTTDRLQIYYPDASSPANLIYDTGDVSTGGAGAVVGPGLATVNFGSATSTGTTVVVVVSQSATVVGWQVGVATIGATTPRGVVTQFPSSFVKLGSETLVLQGAGSNSGKKNEVREGTLLAQNDTAFGRATTGTEITQQEYVVTETAVASGATLQLAGSVAAQAGGVAAGLHVQDERLTLNQYGFQIRIAGQPTARFRLEFGGQPTDVLQVPSGYTGAPGTYAAYLQNQINTKLTNIALELTQGVPGALLTDALATVTELTPGVYSVTFGAARLNNFETALKGVPLQISPPDITSLAEVLVSGSNAPLVNLSDDNAWRGPVTLNSGTRIEVLANTRLSLLGDIVEGAPVGSPGSDLVKRNAGDLTLGGAASNYGGTTYIDEGIVTVVSSRAFGAASTGTADPVTGVTPGGTRVDDGAQLQIQGSLTIAGEALAVEGNGTPTLSSLDSTIRWLSVGPGATNNGTSAPFTGTNPGAPTSGRIQSVSTDVSDPRVIYVTTAGAGAWKTKDGGLTWIPLFDIGLAPTVNTVADSTTPSVTNGLPISALMFGGSIAVAPSNPSVVYYATGDSNGVFNGIPNTNTNAVDNYAGSGVYRSADGGKTWELLRNVNTTNPLYGQAITKLIVDPFNADRIYVASGVIRNGVTNVNNANLNATAGVWRYTPTEAWVNLVATASPGRSAAGQAPWDAAGGNGPGNVGPDDSFTLRFPNGRAANPADLAAEPATWSDIALVVRFDNGVNSQYTLYAALGESSVAGALPATLTRTSQVVRTGVYFTEDPDKAGAGTAGQGVAWWHGKGTLYPTPADAVALASDPDKRSTDGFPLGSLTVNQQRNGYIKLTAATTSTTLAQSGAGAPPRGVSGRTQYPVIGVYASVAKPDSDPEAGEFLEIRRSLGTTGALAGWDWGTAPISDGTLTSAFGDAVPSFRPALGRYDQVIQVADFDPRTLADNNLNELLLGGLDSLFRSTNAAALIPTWSQLGADDRGFLPADQFHALHYDVAGRLLTGSDGGLWRWDRLRFSNLNSNLPAVQLNSADPHPTDFRQAVGGASDTGTQVWNGYNTTNAQGVLVGPSWSRVDNLSTTVSSAPSGTSPTTGSVSGVVRYDPFDPRTIYAVRDGILRKSIDGGANWVSLDPLAAGGNGFTAGDTNSYPNASSGGYDLFPLVMDPLTPNRLLIGGLVFLGVSTNRLMESTDGGATWVNLNSSGLDALPGGSFTPRVIAVAGYQGAFVADSRFPTVTEGLSNTPDPRTIYVSDGARIAVTKNRGVSWALTNFVLPAGGTITDVIVNPVNRDEVYATVSGRPSPGPSSGRIWRSTDAGRTWQDLTGSYDPDAIIAAPQGTNPDQGPLPNIPTWKAAIDPRSGTLYVGNDNGVWVLVDPRATDPGNVARTADPNPLGGPLPSTPPAAPLALHWRRLGDGMPNVQVRDLVINQTTSILTAGTHGRGMFQMFLPDYAANSGAVRAVSGQSRWTGPVVLTGNTRVGAVGTQQIQNGLSAASVDFGGVVSSLGNAPFELEKVGRGTVILSGSNTYTGVTDVQEGVLEVKDPNALGAPTGNTVVRYGAALQVRSDIELEPITINGDGIAFNGHYTGAIRNISGNNTYNGVLTLGTESTSGPPEPAERDLRQVTIGADSGSSLKIGQNPTGQNPAVVGHVQGVTDRILTVTFAGGATPGTNWPQATATGAVAGALTSVTMQDGSTTSTPPTPEVQQFAIPLAAGMVTFRRPNPADPNNPITIGTFDPTSPTFVTDVQTAFRASYSLPALTVTEAQIGFDKELPGTLVLASDNVNYLGLTQVYTGGVEVRSGEALGPVAGSQPTRVSDGAAVRIANNAPNTPTVVTAESLFLSGTGTPDGPGGAGTGALRNTGGNNTWNGPIQLTDIPNFAPTTNPGHQVAFGVTNLADVLSVGPTAGITEDYVNFGQFGLIKVGVGTVRLTTANQYTGVTNINEGTVRAVTNDALGVNVESSEVQTIRVFGGGAGAAGQYQLTVNGNPTGVMISNPAGTNTTTAAQMQALLEAVIAGDETLAPTVFVSSTPNSNGNVYTVTFRGRFTGQNVPQLGFANVASGITVTIATPQEGGLGTVVAAGASLELDGSGLTVDEPLTINGQGVTDADGFRLGALGNRGGNNTYTGPVTFGSATSVGAQPGTDLRVLGDVIGQPTDPVPTVGPTTPATAELTKVGYGTVFFDGAKEYRGRTVVAEGALQINNGGSLGVGRNEVQRLRVTGALGSEKYTLTLFGETTDDITLLAGQPGADAVKAALTIPRSGGNGPILSIADVDVTALTIPGNNPGEAGEAVFIVTFMGRLANTNVPLLTDISPSTPQSVPANLVVDTPTQGQPAGTGVGTNEVQTFIIPNQGGTFTLAGVAGTFDFDVPLATLQAAFDAAFGFAPTPPFPPGTPNTVLTENLLPGNTGRLITINYQGGLSNLNVAQVTGVFNPRLRVRTDTVVDGAGSEAQVVDVRNAVGLQYTLSYTNPLTGQVVTGTRLLGASATEAEFRAALLDPTAAGGLGIGDGITVTTTTQGQSPGTNEVQTFVIPSHGGNISIVGSRPLGTPFNLGPFPVNVPLAALQAAFDDSNAFGPGNTVLTETVLPGNGGRRITVTFTGALAAVDVPQLRVSLNASVTRTTSPGGFQYLVQFGGDFDNVNVLPVTVTIVNGGATIVVTTLQDGFEGTVVNAGASLQTLNLASMTSEWVTINGGGRSKVQTFDVTRAGAGAGTYTLTYLDQATGVSVTGTRILTVGDAAGTVASSTAAEFAAALTDPVSAGGLGLGAGNVSVTRTDTPAGATYTIVFTGALRDVQFSNIVAATGTGVGAFGINELEQGGGGALRMLDSTGNFTTVWGDPVTNSPLILGSNASIGVESPTDVLRLRLPTTDRNPYSAPTTTLGPTNVRGPNQGFSLTKVGQGTLEFNAAGDNDYTGSTLVNDGTLLLNHTGAGSHDAVRGPLVVGDGVDFGGFGPAPAQSQTAVVRLANDNQIANAPAVTVNADGLLDLHGWVETIGNLTINNGVVDTQKPTVPAFPAVPAGTGSTPASGAELTTGTITMTGGRLTVENGDDLVAGNVTMNDGRIEVGTTGASTAVVGTITATNTAEVVVADNARLTSGTIDLTASSLSAGNGATIDTQGATITARRGATSPVTVPTRSTITTGTGATLTTVGAGGRGSVTLIDSDLTAGANSQTLIGALTLNKDTTLPATGSTASFGNGATLNTGGADVTVNESDLSTGTGAFVNVPGPQGRLIATGTAGDRSTVTFGAGTDANFLSVALTLADLDVGAGASLDTTGTTAPDQGVTMTDATADFFANAALTTAAGGLTMTRSTLTGTSGVDINTQAVLLADNSTLSLGSGTAALPATLNTNGNGITVNASTLITGATPDQTTPATVQTGGGALTTTGSVSRRSVVDLGAGTTSNVGPVSLTLSDLTTGASATLNAGAVLAIDSTFSTGSGSVTNTGSIGLTDSNLSFGANSTNAVAGNLTTTDTPATADDGNITFGAGSTTTVSGGVSATNAAVFLSDGASVTAGPLVLTNSTLTLDASAAAPHTTAAVTTVALTEALIDLRANAALSASGAVSVAASPNGSATTGAGTFRLTGPAGNDQTVTVLDGAADEDFTVGSGLTAANGQRVVKAGAGRLTLAPTGTTLTTPLLVAAGDVQVDTVTGPVEVAAGGTVSGNGSTGPINVPSGASVGTVSPGDGWGTDRSGVLTANGDVAFGPTSTLYLNIIGNGTSGVGTQAPGTHYDQLFVNGNVTIADGATLTGLVDTATVRLSNRFVVVRATGSITGPGTGRFAELSTSPGFVFIDGYKFAISYTVDPSTGDSLVVLDKVKVNTTTTLSSANAYDATNGSPSTFNQPVTFTATVSAEPGSRVPPPGTTFVQFYEDTGAGRVPLGGSLPVPISAGGVAVLTVRTLSAGTHTITADYIVDGDSIPDNDDFNQSTSTPPLTQIVEQPAVSVTVATPVPAPISPNNSPGVQDVLQLTAAVTLERAAYIPTITVRDSGGAIVYQQSLPAVGRVHPLNTSQITATWNGTRNVAGSGFVPDGDYTVVVSIFDEWDTTPADPTASTAPLTVRVDNTNPVASGVANAPVIKPGNATPPPPAQTTFTGTIVDNNLGTWTVTVAGPSGFVKSFSGTGPTVNVTWDGTDASNVTAVPDGRYTLTLTTTDAAGNTNTTTPVSRTVYVISTAPTVSLFSGLGTAVGPTTYGDDVTLTAVVALPAFVLAADVNTFLSGKPVSFAFPGTGTLTSNLAFNASLNRYEASVVVPLNLPAGTYSPITATFQPTAELPQATATGSHTVNRAQLRVTAVNTNRPYAELNPDFDFVVNTADLKYGDPATVASGEPTTVATQTSNVGGYAITQGSVTALPNYDVAFTNGVFGITPVPLTVRVNDATRARFAQNPPFTATFEGFKLNDGPGVVNNLNLVTNAQTNSPIGTYAIFSGTTPTATNYFPITVVPGTLTVTGSPNVTVVGSGEGSPAQAQVLSPAGEKLANVPFDGSFNGGIRTATADFNKDGVADYVIGSGPGRQAFLQVIDGASGATLFQAFPFEDFMGGTFVAAGDMTGDGVAELVVTPDEGGGPRVVIYRGGDFAPLVSYFAIDDANFRGGVRPAVGDIDGDGFADLAVSAGFGGGPRISLWDGEKLGKLEFVNMTNDFFAFEQGLRNGAFVSIGDVNGDGLGDLVAGAGPGGGPRVKIYDARTLLSVGGDGATVFADFFAGNVNNRGGVKVAAKNLDGDRFIDLVTGGGKGDRAVATAYRGSALVANSPVSLYEFDLDGTLNGVFVG